MNIDIRTTFGDMGAVVDNSYTIKEVIMMVVKNFGLHPKGHYAIGKQNHIFVEFAQNRTLGECSIKENDVLVLTDYGRCDGKEM